MLDAILLVVGHDHLRDITVLIEVPIDALELTADRGQGNRLHAIANEALHTGEDELGAAHSQPRHIHAVEEGCLELGQIADEVSIVIVSFDLRDLEAIIFPCSVLLSFIIVNIDLLREVFDVTPLDLIFSCSFATQLACKVGGPLLSVAQMSKVHCG